MLNDKHIVDWFSMPDAVSAMRFGKFGREDSSLVLITVGGSLTVKILRRTAQFENMEAAAVVMGPNARQVIISSTEQNYYDIYRVTHQVDSNLLLTSN